MVVFRHPRSHAQGAIAIKRLSGSGDDEKRTNLAQQFEQEHGDNRKARIVVFRPTPKAAEVEEFESRRGLCDNSAGWTHWRADADGAYRLADTARAYRLADADRTYRRAYADRAYRWADADRVYWLADADRVYWLADAGRAYRRSDTARAYLQDNTAGHWSASGMGLEGYRLGHAISFPQ